MQWPEFLLPIMRARVGIPIQAWIFCVILILINSLFLDMHKNKKNMKNQLKHQWTTIEKIQKFMKKRKKSEKKNKSKIKQSNKINKIYKEKINGSKGLW